MLLLLLLSLSIQKEVKILLLLVLRGQKILLLPKVISRPLAKANFSPLLLVEEKRGGKAAGKKETPGVSSSLFEYSRFAWREGGRIFSLFQC